MLKKKTRGTNAATRSSGPDNQHQGGIGVKDLGILNQCLLQFVFLFPWFFFGTSM
jgi:hypothetical protein